MDHYGLLSLIPTVFVITTAVLTHRPVAALLVGVVIGILLLDPTTAVSTFSEIMLEVMQDETIGWVIMVCGLMGSLIYILIRTGGASAFARKMAEKANTRNKSMLVTWFLGMMLFIDDYLNAIAIGNSMKKVTDKFKVSRAMLSYVVDSTAAPTCVLVPISTWAVFFAAVLEGTGAAAADDIWVLDVASGSGYGTAALRGFGFDAVGVDLARRQRLRHRLAHILGALSSACQVNMKSLSRQGTISARSAIRNKPRNINTIPSSRCARPRPAEKARPLRPSAASRKPSVPSDLPRRPIGAESSARRCWGRRLSPGPSLP